MNERWYVIYTKAQCEKKVAALLEKRKIKNYLPLNQIEKNVPNGKRKFIAEPLLPTFIFVHVGEEDMDAIRKTNCVLNFVYWLGKPAIVSNDEIMDMDQFTKIYSDIKLLKTAVTPGNIFKITTDSKINFFENIISVKNDFIYLGLPSLGYVLSAKHAISNIDLFNYSLNVNNLVS